MNDMNDNPDAHPKSTGGLVCGIIGCIFGATGYFSIFGFPFCLIAWILGAKAVNRARAMGVGAAGSAITAKVMGILGTIATGIATLIVIILAAVALPNYCRYRGLSENLRCESNLRVLETAGYDAKLHGEKFDSPEDLVGEDNFLKELPKCPAGGEYRLTIDETTGIVTCICTKHGSCRQDLD